MQNQQFWFRVEKKQDDQWSVCLPHQCGEWEVTDEYDGAPYEVAVQRLEQFIAEAQNALHTLKSREQQNQRD
jgi:hypothetical protein